MSLKYLTSAGTRVELINTGNFLIDGGSMFGRVPRMEWERHCPADGQHRISLATNIARITRGHTTILVDCGLGSRYEKADEELLGIDTRLTRLDLPPVDHLICTHLHFDHVGGVHDLKIRDRIFVSRREWHDAHHEDDISRGSCRPEDLDRMEAHLELIDAPREILPGITCLATPGHTAGHMSVLIDDEILYAGDFLPTTAHLQLPWISSYDLYPLTVLETKRHILEQACERGWLVVFEHDTRCAAGHVVNRGGSYQIIP